jgi:hypothetical protein
MLSKFAGQQASGSSHVLGHRDDWDLGLVTQKIAAEEFPVSQGESDNGEQPKSDQITDPPEAHDVPVQVDSQIASDNSSTDLFSELGAIAASVQKRAAKCKYCEHHVDYAEALEKGCCDSCAKTRKEKGMEPFAKKADGGVAVLPGNLQKAEDANVNAMRESLDAQKEFEVGKSIQEKEQEVQSVEKDHGIAEEHVPGVGNVESKEVVIPKDEVQGRQVIINIAKQKVKETEAKMTRVASKKTAGPFGIQNSPGNYSVDTPSYETTEDSPNVERCSNCDQARLLEPTGLCEECEIELQEGPYKEGSTPITNDGAGGAMGGTDIDAHTPQISAIKADLASDSAADPSIGECGFCGKRKKLCPEGVCEECSPSTFNQSKDDTVHSSPDFASNPEFSTEIKTDVLKYLQSHPEIKGEIDAEWPAEEMFRVHVTSPDYEALRQFLLTNGYEEGVVEENIEKMAKQAASADKQEKIDALKRKSIGDGNPEERKKIEREIRHVEEGKEAGFNYYFPGQALREFYPELQHELVDYPNANNSPMIEDIDISQGYDNDIAAAVEGSLETTKLSYVSTSPAAGAGIGRDGKPEVLEGAPLRREQDIRGPQFTDEFYQNYDAGPDGAALAIVSHKVAAEDEAGQFTKFLTKVCGEIAATLVAGFKVTSRPLMDKIPGVGEVQLAQVEKAQPSFMAVNMSLVDPASRVKYLLEKLTDSQIQGAIDDSWAQSCVWCEGVKNGFSYEVFVRASSIDTDSMVLTYEFVCGTKESE